MYLGCIPGQGLRDRPFAEQLEAVASVGLRHVHTAARNLTSLTPEEIRAAMRRTGVQIDNFFGTGLSPAQMGDPAKVEAGKAALEANLKLAQAIGCPVICGSAGHGGYTMRLDSRRPELMDEIVACWKLAAPLLEKYRIYLGFESGIHTTLWKPDQFKELFDRVGSEWLTTTMDVTNMLSAEDYYDQHPKIDALFDRCRGRVHSAHLKDIMHEEKLHTHLNEAVPGEGNLDWEYVLVQLDRALPSWGAGYIEATPWEKMPAAIDFVRTKAKAVGMSIE